MKILITGSQGQVGQEVTLACQAQGWETLAYTSKNFDITQTQELPDVDYVINCAAYTAVDQAEDHREQAFLVNATGTHNLAKACKEKNIPLIQLSTDYVFDGNKKTAYCEEDHANPLNVYGASKWQGEELLRATWDRHLILRVSWVFGRFGNNFVKTILRLAQERDELKIIADQLGGPTGARHIAKVICTLLQHPKLHDHWGTYHYTDAPVTNWFEFAKNFITPSICKILPLLAAEYPSKTTRPYNSALNCDKIFRTFGITQANWQEELQGITDGST